MDTNNDSRNNFIDVGLENVVVAGARVVEEPSRSGLKKVHKTSKSTKRLRESFFSRDQGRTRAVNRGEPEYQ